ncbi:hypothetical protein SUGI_0394630 [Cryptomeria japonica]|nr:hypothetical protein SUGI_0394630 [Cryptomeria japonica]
MEDIFSASPKAMIIKFFQSTQFINKDLNMYHEETNMGAQARTSNLNDDGVTVASMDVLVSKVGVLMSGSQREERYEVLEKRLNELGLPLGHRAFSDCHAILQQNQIFTFHKH